MDNDPGWLFLCRLMLAQEAEREMAGRKLRLAEFQLQQLGADMHANKSHSTAAAPAFRDTPRLAETSSNLLTDAPEWLTSAAGALRADVSALPAASASMAENSVAAVVQPHANPHTVVPRCSSEATSGAARCGATGEREAELLRRVAALQAKLGQQQAEFEALLASTRHKDESLEAMLREMTQTMQAEVGRAGRMQETHEKEIRTARAAVARLEKEVQEARRAQAAASVAAAARARGPASHTEPGGLGDRIAERLLKLPSALKAELQAEDVMLEHGGDSLAAAPQLLLPALTHLCYLHEQNVQLAAASEAVMAAQADAVRKLAASSATTSSSAAGVASTVVGSAVSYLRGVRRPENVAAAATAHVSEPSRRDAEAARLRANAAPPTTTSTMAGQPVGQTPLPPTAAADSVTASTEVTMGAAAREAAGAQQAAPDAATAEIAAALPAAVGLSGGDVGGASNGASNGGGGGGGGGGAQAAGVQNSPPKVASAALTTVTATPKSTLPTPTSALSSANLPVPVPTQTPSTPTQNTPMAANCALAAAGTPPPGTQSEVAAPSAFLSSTSSSQQSASSSRNAKAVKYVDTLLGRANREKIPEEDARQANEYFEAAKSANATEDYKSACSYFETSFLLNPKLTTLISTANMHLKLRNPTVASEIYTRLLQNPSVPQREREVALRKMAICETMLGAASDAPASRD